MKTLELKNKLIENMKDCEEKAESAISAFSNFFKESTIDSAFRDSLYYCSGKRLWDDDPESGEKEILIIECNRKIELDLQATDFFMLTLCLEYPLSFVSSVSTYQSEWCVDKTKIQDWLAAVKDDPLYIAIKNIKPQRVKIFAFPVKV